MSRGDHQSLKQQRRVFALQIGFRLEREMADDDEKKVSELQEGPFILVYTILHFSRAESPNPITFLIKM